MNRNFYQNARKRCMPMGTNIVTDADIILMQEEEVERYRDRIRCLEERCKDKIRYFEEKMREKDNDKVVRIGDTITVEGNNGKVTFKLLECVVHLGAWTKGNVELCGVTEIGEEIDRLAKAVKAMEDRPCITEFEINIEGLSE